AGMLLVVGRVLVVAGSSRRSTVLLVLTPKGAVEQTGETPVVLDYAQIESISTQEGLRMTETERRMGGMLFLPGSGAPQTTLFIRERSGRSWEWVPDRRITYSTSVLQQIIADFPRYVARNRRIGFPLTYC